MCTWTEILLGSDVRERWAVRVVDTSPRGPLNQQPDRLYLQRILPNARILADAARALAAHRPHVAHIATNFGWSLWRTAAFVAAFEAAGVPSVVHLHGGDFAALFERRSPRARRVLQAALRRAAATVAITRPTAAYLRTELGLRGVHYVPNFIDTNAFAVPSARRNGHEGDGVLLLYVGWVMEGKGVLDLLDALAAVPGARLRVVGPWVPSGERDSRELFWERVRERGLEERVDYAGEVPRHEMPAHYADADVFVLPSHREGMPLAALEALAAGLPVVATRVGALPEVVAHGETGLLVEPHAPDQLAAALGRLVREPALREAMGRRAAAWAQAHVAVGAVLGQLEAIWRAVAKEAGAP